MGIASDTSNPYADPLAVELNATDFVSGALRITSYARPGKLFTANDRLITDQVGVLKKEVTEQLVQTVVEILQAGL